MKLTEHEKYILDLARKAVDYWERGDPVKDAIDDYEINEALELLVKLADNTKVIYEMSNREYARNEYAKKQANAYK